MVLPTVSHCDPLKRAIGCHLLSLLKSRRLFFMMSKKIYRFMALKFCVYIIFDSNSSHAEFVSPPSSTVPLLHLSREHSVVTYIIS